MTDIDFSTLEEAPRYEVIEPGEHTVEVTGASQGLTNKNNDKPSFPMLILETVVSEGSDEDGKAVRAWLPLGWVGRSGRPQVNPAMQKVLSAFGKWDRAPEKRKKFLGPDAIDGTMDALERDIIGATLKVQIETRPGRPITDEFGNGTGENYPDSSSIERVLSVTVKKAAKGKSITL